MITAEPVKKVCWAQVSRMKQYGGSFARAIAEAWYLADDTNRAKLEEAFADLFSRYVAKGVQPLAIPE